jgi:uncharacterized membrane-anchored protein
VKVRKNNSQNFWRFNTCLSWVDSRLYFNHVNPREFNISPDGYITAIIGALALALRYLLKRKYHIKSAMSAQPSQKV